VKPVEGYAPNVESAAAEHLHAQVRALETRLAMLGNRNDPTSQSLRDELNRGRDALISRLRRLENPSSIADPPAQPLSHASTTPGDRAFLS
jgi:hypothetical protein